MHRVFQMLYAAGQAVSDRSVLPRQTLAQCPGAAPRFIWTACTSCGAFSSISRVQGKGQAASGTLHNTDRACQLVSDNESAVRWEPCS